MAGGGSGITGTGASAEIRPLQLRLHATPQAAVELREALRSWLEGAGATVQETFDVTLACSEAFANSIGNPLRPATLIVDVERSEERRVGKECRSRWSPYH